MSGSVVPLRTSRWEWAQTVLLCVNLAWTTLRLGGFRAETMVTTSSLTAALLAVHALSLVFGKRSSGEREACMPGGAGSRGDHARNGVGLVFVPFLAYAAANVVWISPVKWLGWLDWFGWAQMAAVFWVVLNGIQSRAPVRAVWATIFVLGVTSVLFGCYQYFVSPEWLMLGRIQAEQYAGRASGAFGIPNSQAAFLLLLLPVAGALALRRGAAATARVFFGWLAAVFLLGLLLTISRGAWLGFAAAVTAWPLLSGGAWRRRLGGACAVGCAVAVLGGTAYLASPRVRERIDQLVSDLGERSRPILWRAGWRIFQEHPLTGSGAGSFDLAFEGHRPEGFIFAPKWAHNDYLNTLSDYGLIGFVLLFGGVLLVLADARRRGRADGADSALRVQRPAPDPFGDPLVRQAQAVGLLAFGLQLFVDFHFKVPALALATATVAALAVRGRQRAATPVQPSHSRFWWRRVVPAVFAGGAIAILAGVVPRFRAEALRDGARESIDRLFGESLESPRFAERVSVARGALARAVSLDPANAQAWADHAYATAQSARAGRLDPVALGRMAEADANRAIALSPSVAEFWIRRGVARDMQGRWLEAGNDFTRALSLSPKAPLPWYHYAYHLTLHPTGHDMAAAMVATCLRLDPNNREGIRLRQQLATGHTGP